MKRIKYSTILMILGLFLIVAGGLTLLQIIRSQQNNQVVSGIPSSKVVATPMPPSTLSGFPSELQLPSLNLDLSVIPGVYNPKNKTWTLSLDKVQYATSTPLPNNAGGNTFIYGHYRKGVLATLHTIHIGDQAIVNTTNGHSFYYQLASVRVTNPNDTSVFNYQGKSPILTIQTCTGLFFQNRQLFTFDLVKAV